MITGETSLYCVIGDPVVHSLSPVIMNRALEEYACDGVYLALRVSPELAARALDGMRVLGVRGANVTYPLKDIVLGFADEVSDTARALEAANWLDFAEGRIRADNTDAPGVATALETFGDMTVENASVVIFGAGGAGRAAAWGLLAGGARAVTFAVRDPAKAQPICQRCVAHFDGRPVAAVGFEPSARNDAADEAVAAADIIINATPVGMSGFPQSPLAVSEEAIREGQCWFDFVYHPRDTDFLATARVRGARTVDGLALLVAQAHHGFRLWTGHAFSVTDMYDYVVARPTGADTTGQR